LDIDHSLETLGLLQELASDGKAVAVALHDLNAVMRWADQVALLNSGRLQAFGTVGDVVRDDLIEPVFGVRVERILSASGGETLVFHRSEAVRAPDDGGMLAARPRDRAR